MSSPENRRDFLRKGSAAAAVLATGTASAAAQEPAKPPAGTQVPPGGPEARAAQVPIDQNPADIAAEAEKYPHGERFLPEHYKVFDRYYPSYGGPVGRPTYQGKLVPGFRASGLPPVPFVQPDVPRMPWKLVDGVKEFHVILQHVRREVLPGKWIDFYGVNGTMPAPYIEITQGDHVRFVVHNQLPEPTTVHWHGAELPANMDGVPGVTQDLIEPGSTYVYEFPVHQAGTFFYHAHIPLQEANGLIGFMIIHPATAWDPPVDRDFGLLFQNISLGPNTTVTTPFIEHNSVTPTIGGYNWQFINGRSAPYTTPLVCKLGERIRIRIFNFSPQSPHSIHMHGMNFWVTGHEGARQEESAWIVRNTQIIHVAQDADIEFIAYDAGDWVLHCHMALHMLNHPVAQMGPRIRSGDSVAEFKSNLDTRPPVKYPETDPGFQVPGYPRIRMGKEEWTPDELAKLASKKEVRGMRHNWYDPLRGLFTVVRVLPHDLYDLVMNSNQPLEPGATFDEIVRRRQKQIRNREELRARGLTAQQMQEWQDMNVEARQRGEL